MRTSSLHRTLSKTHSSLMDIMRPDCIFSDLHERPSTERRQTFPCDLEASNAALEPCKSSEALAESVHGIRLPVRHSTVLEFAVWMWDQCNCCLASKEALQWQKLRLSSFCRRSRTVAWDFVSSCTSFQLQQMSHWLTGWRGNLKPAIEHCRCQTAARAFAGLLLWQSCIAESKCSNNSFVAAQLYNSSNCMDKHSQTTSEEICRPWLPVPPSKMRGQHIWREDMCRCWVGFSTVCQRCCRLVLSFGFVTEPSASCVRSWSYCLSELVFLEGELSIHTWRACCMG